MRCKWGMMIQCSEPTVSMSGLGSIGCLRRTLELSQLHAGYLTAALSAILINQKHPVWVCKKGHQSILPSWWEVLVNVTYIQRPPRVHQVQALSMFAICQYVPRVRHSESVSCNCLDHLHLWIHIGNLNRNGKERKALQINSFWTAREKPEAKKYSIQSWDGIMPR